MRKCPARCLLAFGLAVSKSLAAADQAIIRTLQIRGTQRALALETRAGEAFDLALVERDVRRLWATRWFDDIAVEADESPQGVDMAFVLKEKARFYLRHVRFEPGTERFPVELEDGSAVDAELAARLAGQLRRELVEQGYAEALVDASLVPAGFHKADLVIRVKRGQLYEVEEVRFTGSPGLPLKELRHALTATRARRMLPSLGSIWGGWRLRAPFSQQRLESDLARLRSLYLSRGYFDARVEVGEVKIEKGKARIVVNVAAGPRYDARQVEIPAVARTIPLDRGEAWFNQEFCRCLHHRDKYAASP